MRSIRGYHRLGQVDDLAQRGRGFGCIPTNLQLRKVMKFHPFVGCRLRSYGAVIIQGEGCDAARGQVFPGVLKKGRVRRWLIIWMLRV